jgi:hypothetical protein
MVKEDINTKLAVLTEKVDNINVTVQDIKDKMEKKYVSLERFQIIERIVYGMVTLILVAVVGALIRLVVLQ